MSKTKAGWESYVRKVEPYVPGEQPKQADIIKLNTNENPYPPAPGVTAALQGIAPDSLRLYPDPTVEDLVQALAKRYGVSPEQVFVGVGSDDVISMCFLTFFGSDRPILFPDITYSFYDVWANLYKIPFTRVPLDDHFSIRAEDYVNVENGGIIFPNPNAPTGVETAQSDIRRILEANPDSVVIVDEAYVDFGATSALPLLKEYDNLLVVQTFSKSRSLAGMRIGFAIGSPKMIQYLNDVKYSFNSYTMSRIAIAAGVASVEDEAYFKAVCEKIMETREWTKKELSALGFAFPDAKSNFLFATHASIPAKELFEALKAQGIYVRYFPKPRIDQYLRITIGTPEQMQVLVAFLKEYIEGRN